MRARGSADGRRADPASHDDWVAVDVLHLKERYRLLVCAAIYAGVAAMAGCGGGDGGDVKFDSPAYKNGYDCGSGESPAANAPTPHDAIVSCRSEVLGAGHTVTPESEFKNGVS